MARPYKNKNWLEHEYWVEKRSLEDIAQLMGVTDPTILYWMRKHDIPRRELSEAITIAADERLLDEQWLREKYVNERKTIREIADECDAGRTAVHEALKRAGIEIRIKSEYGKWADKSNSSTDKNS